MILSADQNWIRRLNGNDKKDLMLPSEWIPVTVTLHQFEAT